MKITLCKVNLPKQAQRTGSRRWIKILSLCFRIQRLKLMFHRLAHQCKWFSPLLILASEILKGELWCSVFNWLLGLCSSLLTNIQLQKNETWKQKRKKQSQMFLKLRISRSQRKSILWIHMTADQFYPVRAHGVWCPLMILWQIGYIFICRYKYITEGFISQKKHILHEDLKCKFDLFFSKPLCI